MEPIAVKHLVAIKLVRGGAIRVRHLSQGLAAACVISVVILTDAQLLFCMSVRYCKTAAASVLHALRANAFVNCTQHRQNSLIPYRAQPNVRFSNPLRDIDDPSNTQVLCYARCSASDACMRATSADPTGRVKIWISDETVIKEGPRWKALAQHLKGCM